MRYLYSQWTDKGYLILGAENNVAKLFELLGLYLAFQENSPAGTSFLAYYQENKNMHPYHFRNKGEKAVRTTLMRWESEHSECCPHHSRRNFRLLSKTWTGLPVIASDDMGAIFFALSDMLLKISDTVEVVNQLFPVLSSDSILGFQYQFLTDYALPNARIKSVAKRTAFRAVYNTWINNPLFKKE